MDSNITDQTIGTDDLDLFHQNISFIGPDGSTLNINLDDIHDYMRYAAESCANQGTQIGATIAVLVVLLLVTKAEKRKSPVFILNSLSLLVNIPRTVLQVVFFTSAWYHPYTYFTNDISNVPAADYANTAVAELMTFFLTALVEASLMLQIWAVTTTLDRRYRIPLIGIPALAALFTIGLAFAIAIVSIRMTFAGQDPTATLYVVLGPAKQITFCCSVIIFAAVFSGKLGYALIRRRSLGLKKFGPMQIIFIMSCQTLIIPAIFTIFQFTANVPDLGSQALTVTALFLPLSSIWASASLTNRTPAVSAAPSGQMAGPASYNSASLNTASDRKSVLSDVKRERTLSIED